MKAPPWVLLAAMAVVAGAYLVPPGVSSSRDYVLLHSLNRQYWADAVHHLRLPLWNPHVGLGRPFLADVETTTLYPTTLLYLLGPTFGLASSLFLHFVLAGLGMRAFARRLAIESPVADAMAIVFLLSGPLGARLLVGQIGFAQALCYLPLAFAQAVAVQDAPGARSVSRLALVLGLQLLAGHPQMSWITWLGLAVFLVGRRLHGLSRQSLPLVGRDLGFLALTVAGGLGLGAVVLLPFGELAAESNRTSPSVTFASSYALPVAGAGSLFLSPDRQVVEQVFQWENNLYGGALVPLAAVCALLTIRRPAVTALGLVVAVSLLLALGTRTPLFALAYQVLPGLSQFRVPARIATLAPFALLTLAGLFLSEPRIASLRRRTPIAVAVVAGGVSVASWAWVFRASDFSWLAFHLGLLAATTWVVVRWAASSGNAWGARRAAILAVVMLDLGTAAWVWRSAIEPREVAVSEGLLAQVLRSPEFVRAGGEPARVWVPIGVARHNAGMALGFSTPAGYVALSLDRVWTTIHEGIGVPLPLNNTFPAPALFRQPFPYDSMDLVVGYDPPTQRLVGRPPADPRVYVVPCAEPIADWREAVDRMAAGHDFHRCALVERLYAGAIPSRLASGTAQIVSFAPERVVVRTDSEGETLVVLAEAWYPGWEARASGAGPLPTLPVNAWMRGAVVPAGRHEVVFAYRSRLLWPGALLSLALLVPLTLAARRPTRGSP